jgi:hypothetical protein
VDHEHVPVLIASIFALGASAKQRHRMVIVGHHVVDLHAEGAAAELHRLGEEAKDRVHAAVVTRELVAARHIPDGVLIHRLPEGVDVALGEVGPLIRLVAGSAGDPRPGEHSTA